MKLKLTKRYDKRNGAGDVIEIVDIKRDDLFSSNFGVLAKLNGHELTWLTIDWFLPEHKGDNDETNKGQT